VLPRKGKRKSPGEEECLVLIIRTGCYIMTEDRVLRFYTTLDKMKWKLETLFPVNHLAWYWRNKNMTCTNILKDTKA